MTEPESKTEPEAKTEPEGKSELKNLAIPRRRPMTVSQEGMVRQEPLVPGQSLPWMIQPALKGVSLVAWAEANRELVQGLVLRHGGVLFRGFNERTVDEFEHFTRAISMELLEYRERSSPRSQVSGKVYTSTDYPADQEIFLHNENSYQHVWPTKIFFFCVTAAAGGGATPIADCRQVYERIPPAIRDRFREKRWMYVRNFGDGFGLPWQTVFQTSDPAAVERHCREHGVEVEWKSGGRLRTRAVRPAMVRHPQTGEMTWFNHATFFHVSTLIPSVQEALLAEFDEEDLPANTYYGDGSPIAPADLDELRGIYADVKVSFPWQEGDLLMLDNLLVAHGRAPYTGARKIVVGMAEPRRWEEVEVA
jgi:alpha-ketoglutarate-dependent taurine dioxygenase